MAVPPPPPLSPLDEKRTIRATLRASRAAHVARLRDEGCHDAAHAAAAHALAHVPAGATVALYRSLGDELDPAPFADLLIAAGHRLALPHVDRGDPTMRFLAWHPEAPLFEGMFGLRQPHDASEPVVPDVIVTPLVGFDRAGGRIGQGGGFYDRAFALLPGAFRIGYGWSAQEIATVPRDPWDIALDGIATEREWIDVTKTGQ
ncbi:5-formyltetrahydrofolate cyclo-ligase [Sphingomonas nostoxanthinifaciens]|uniref:5-formyltetrahydrofolate cyclo-ligase n=1 Tax=Sphingomonas nostoxanthinifaciens TaxID=2872652 RepID=UPI001CC1EDAD|nr:5-formyltetrahydrofolate cyclo-ligase [Sphingomonas nostoxanthinifaciens]UAK23915.1 5-formyltetrahydrofolate cyclo-ligase [Sphingomonas nostoxanthinifaciens]